MALIEIANNIITDPINWVATVESYLACEYGGKMLFRQRTQRTTVFEVSGIGLPEDDTMLDVQISQVVKGNPLIVAIEILY